MWAVAVLIASFCTLQVYQNFSPLHVLAVVHNIWIVGLGQVSTWTNHAVMKTLCFFMSWEVFGTGTFPCAHPLQTVGPCADFLWATCIHIPALGLISTPLWCRCLLTVSVLQLLKQCVGLFLMGFVFQHETNNIKIFFHSIKLMIKLLELYVEGLEPSLTVNSIRLFKYILNKMFPL